MWRDEEANDHAARIPAEPGQNFKHLRRAKHTHHPVDDARGNAEALLHMRDELGLRIELG
jgi:hypothetical protein